MDAWHKYLARRVKAARRAANEEAHLQNVILDRQVELKLQRLGLPNYVDGSYKGPPVAEEAEPERIDAMDLPGPDVAALLRARGVEPFDAMPHGISSQPQRSQVDPRVQARLDAIREEERERAEQRAAALKQDAINARTASPREIAHRLAQLGLDSAIGRGFREPPPPKSEREPISDPVLVREKAERRARTTLSKKLMRAQAAGRPVDARTLNELEYAELLRRRGLSEPKWANRPDPAGSSRAGWNDLPLPPSKE